jgi:hypothetical protein
VLCEATGNIRLKRRIVLLAIAFLAVGFLGVWLDHKLEKN